MVETETRESRVRVGMLGSGLMGGKLGTRSVRAGHEVVFSDAHSEQKLKRLAREAKGNTRAGTSREAAPAADALLLAVHGLRMDDGLSQAGDLSGKVIITCSLSMDADKTGLVIGQTASGAEERAKKLPKARVVCAFNTVPSEGFFGVYEARRRANRPRLVYGGDDAGSQAVAAELIRDVGFAPIDAGPVRIARYPEPFARLMGQLAYEGEEGLALAYRFERFGDGASW